MNISRSRAAEIARETAEITRDGFYTDASGQTHNIATEIETAVAKTRLYAPDWKPEFKSESSFETRVEVTNETTFSAARRLFDEGRNAASLNFASATSVGGGWLNGARAQEEYLCRNSVLAQCIGAQREFYNHHREHRAPRYSDMMLYSPDVAVIRDEFDNLCASWPASIITAAAPNLGHGMAIPLDELRELWRVRITRVFDIALANGHDSLVLGAWGCGAFHNDPTMVARAFAEVAEAYDGRFELLFAVLDVGLKQGNFEAFEKQFQLNRTQITS